ncbi:MAG: hypothetical protein SGPRY_003794 [Prymnesium sp.]
MTRDSRRERSQVSSEREAREKRILANAEGAAAAALSVVARAAARRAASNGLLHRTGRLLSEAQHIADQLGKWHQPGAAASGSQVGLPLSTRSHPRTEVTWQSTRRLPRRRLTVRTPYRNPKPDLNGWSSPGLELDVSRLAEFARCCSTPRGSSRCPRRGPTC